jgi:phosphatidylglycerophosphatase A
MKRRLSNAIAVWFGCGLVPKGPGTAGALGALLVAWVLWTVLQWPPIAFGLLAAVFLIPGIWAADEEAKYSGKKDPQHVVVDEVIGQWITLAAATRLDDWKPWLFAFVLFRLFDIWKPPPVRALEKLPGGTGIVMDDVMAGIYGALVLWLAGWNNLY